MSPQQRTAPRLHAALAAAALAVTASAASTASAATSGSAQAVIDWSSVLITPSASSGYSIFGVYAGVYTYADVNAPPLTVTHQAEDFSSMAPKLAVADASAAPHRSYTLQAAIDLTDALSQSVSTSSTNDQAGYHNDLSSASRWIYIVPSGDATFRLQGRYSLALQGQADPAGDPVDEADMTAGAGIVVLSESLGETFVDHRTSLAGYVDRYTPGGALASARTEHFDETVTLLAGEIYRIEFDTWAAVAGNTAPVPEPASGLLWLGGLAVLGTAVRRRA